MALRWDDSGQGIRSAERGVKKVLDILLVISDYHDRNTWAGGPECDAPLVSLWKGGFCSFKDSLTSDIPRLSLQNGNLNLY